MELHNSAIMGCDFKQHLQPFNPFIPSTIFGCFPERIFHAHQMEALHGKKKGRPAALLKRLCRKYSSEHTFTKDLRVTFFLILKHL